MKEFLEKLLVKKVGEKLWNMNSNQYPLNSRPLNPKEYAGFKTQVGAIEIIYMPSKTPSDFFLISFTSRINKGFSSRSFRMYFVKDSNWADISIQIADSKQNPNEMIADKEATLVICELIWGHSLAARQKEEKNNNYSALNFPRFVCCQDLKTRKVMIIDLEEVRIVQEYAPEMIPTTMKLSYFVLSSTSKESRFKKELGLK